MSARASAFSRAVRKRPCLLRAWLRRLRSAGVEFRTGARLACLTREGDLWRLDFADGEELFAPAPSSWPSAAPPGRKPDRTAPGRRCSPRTAWRLAPFVAANCGWNVAWPAAVLERAEGLPLKNLSVSAAGETVSGELLITRYGLEGGAIYRLGPVLRAMARPELRIDFKPQVTAEVLRERARATARA